MLTQSAFYLFMESFRWWLSLAIHIVCFILVAADCLKHRREPASAMLWIFLAFVIPVFGSFLYLVFGINRVPEKAFKKNIADKKLLAERKAREDEALSLVYWRNVHESALSSDTLQPFDKRFDNAVCSLLPEYPLLGGNKITTLIDGDEFYPRLFDEIRKAKNHIHMQSFIIDNGKTGRELLDLLSAKAAEGVLVRLMFDRFGSTRAFLTGFFRKYAKMNNFMVKGWTQADPLKKQFQINLRNHRKIAIMDGRKAFTGGINIQAGNLTEGDTMAIRDYQFEIDGPIVQELQYSFIRDWYFMAEEDPENLLNETLFPHVPMAGSSAIRLVNSGPSSEMEAIADVFFMAISAAQKQIILTTPYFVPPNDIIRALRTASMRGVDIRLIVPEKNNHFYAGLASHALYEDLLSCGVRIYERRLPFMHAKSFIVDDELAIVGSANFDARSFKLNYETNLIVYDDNFVESMKEIAIDEMAQSSEIFLAEWRNRPVSQKVFENLAYLMMPVL